MRPIQKSYHINSPQITEPHFIEVDAATVTDRRNGHRYTVQASRLDTPNGVSRALISAYFRIYDGKSLQAFKTAWMELRYFCGYVADDFPSIIEVTQIGTPVFKGYRMVLRRLVAQKAIAVRTAHQRFQRPQAIVAEALRSKGRALVTISNPFPGIGRASNPKKHITASEMRRVLSAAKRDVRTILLDFDECKNLPSESSLRAARDYAIKKWSGIVPPHLGGDEKEFLALCARAGGLDRVVRSLHATRDTLIPFMLLIGYSTAANIESLAAMRRDCVRKDQLLPGSYFIRWWKGRSGEQSVMRSDVSPWSAPVLIRRVIELTAPLVPHASSHERDLLFLARGTGANGQLGRLSSGMWLPGLRNFIERHSLKRDDGAPLEFTFEMLRPSVLSELYRRTGNILAIRRFANHRDIATTIRYVVDRITEEKHDIVISKSQSRLVKFLRDGRVAAVGSRGKQTSSTTPLSIGISNNCSDLSRGPTAPGDRCPAWMWPLNEPGLVIPDEPRYAAELLRERCALEDARSLMNQERFAFLFGGRISSIDDILARFSPEVLKQGEILTASLSPLPSLVHE